jgi:predicted anti-sigma-YlaC factor YlaD
LLTCKEVSVLLSEGQDRPLGALERARLEAHLQVCRGCENFHKQLGFLRQAFRRHPALRDPDDQD